MTQELIRQLFHTARNADSLEAFERVVSDILSASIADTAGAKARESLQLTCEQAIRLNAALESPSEPNEALKGAMEKFRAQESRERVSMTYEQFTELASKAKASNDLHMRVLALEASSYLKDEEISHLRKRIAAPTTPSVADAAGAKPVAYEVHWPNGEHELIYASALRMISDLGDFTLTELYAAPPAPSVADAAWWQPIETAPKDGTKIVLGKADLVSIGEWLHEEAYIRERRDEDGRYIDQDESDGFDGWVDWHGGYQDWTHWMPLPPAPSVADAAGASEPTRWQKAQALFGGGGSAAHLPENIDWTRVMALAEKHGDGWSNEKGWSFHCDDDLFNFAGELAKESGND